MNINLTLIIQMVVFAILIWFTMKFVWPMILGAMVEREKKIAAGLAAAEQGQKDLSEAKSRAEEVIKEARARALTIEANAQARANQASNPAGTGPRCDGTGNGREQIARMSRPTLSPVNGSSPSRQR